MVRTGTRTPEKVDRAEAPMAVAAAMKDGPISELTITEKGHRPSQFKKLWDVLPVFCADRKYGGLDEVLRTGHD